MTCQSGPGYNIAADRQTNADDQQILFFGAIPPNPSVIAKCSIMILEYEIVKKDMLKSGIIDAEFIDRIAKYTN